MEPIQSYLTSSVSIWNTFITTLENTFLGKWVWIFFLLVIDFAVFAKSRNEVLAMFVNTLITIVFYDYFPPQAINISIIITGAFIGFSIYKFFRGG